MKILITGATGFIGSAFSKLALTRGQLSALSLTTLAFFLIEAGLLIIALIR